MKYIVNIENPTPDVLRQVWFSIMQQRQNITGNLPEPMSKDLGDMKIFISVADAEPNLIAGIGKVLAYADLDKKPVEVKPSEPVAPPVVEKSAIKQRKKHKWSAAALRNIKKVSPEAPWGLKLDGTPRKKPGGEITFGGRDTTLGSAFYKLFEDEIK
jgi:hypothetical protein